MTKKRGTDKPKVNRGAPRKGGGIVEEGPASTGGGTREPRYFICTSRPHWRGHSEGGLKERWESEGMFLSCIHQKSSRFWNELGKGGVVVSEDRTAIRLITFTGNTCALIEEDRKERAAVSLQAPRKGTAGGIIAIHWSQSEKQLPGGGPEVRTRKQKVHFVGKTQEGLTFKKRSPNCFHHTEETSGDGKGSPCRRMREVERIRVMKILAQRSWWRNQ